MIPALVAKRKRRSQPGNWLIVTYHEGKIWYCTWVRTWAGVQMSKRSAEKYIHLDKQGNRMGCVIVMDIERMADFAATEGANEIQDLFKLFEKS